MLSRVSDLSRCIHQIIILTRGASVVRSEPLNSGLHATFGLKKLETYINLSYVVRIFRCTKPCRRESPM